MVDLTARDVTFTIHGLDKDDRAVDGSVFAKKIREIIAALSAADKQVNKAKRHRYMVVDLKIGSAEMTLGERAISADAPPALTSVPVFLDAIDAVYRNNAPAFHRLNGLGSSIAKLCGDAGERYAFVEITSPRLSSPILIDERVSRQVERLQAESVAELPVEMLFRGEAEDAFDGEIKEIDLRGKLPKGKFILSGGKKEIDCVFPHFTVDQLRKLIDCRVWVEGLAIYDGVSGLPGRIEVHRAHPIHAGTGMTSWQGKLSKPEGESEWGDWLDG